MRLSQNKRKSLKIEIKKIWRTNLWWTSNFKRSERREGKAMASEIELNVRCVSQLSIAVTNTWHKQVIKRKVYLGSWFGPQPQLPCPVVSGPVGRQYVVAELYVQRTPIHITAVQKQKRQRKKSCPNGVFKCIPQTPNFQEPPSPKVPSTSQSTKPDELVFSIWLLRHT